MRPHIVQTSASPEMTPQAVLEIIDQARRQEARSGAFLRQMKEKAARLPGSVVVDGYQPATSLFQFAVVKVNVVGATETWVSPATVTATLAVGWLVSTKV